MHLFEVAFYTAGTLYAVFCEQILILYFLIVVGIYMALSTFLPGVRSLNIRKKFMVGTWTPPSEGVVINKMKIRVDTILDYLDSLPKENRPTLTHFVIKGVG